MKSKRFECNKSVKSDFLNLDFTAHEESIVKDRQLLYRSKKLCLNNLPLSKDMFINCVGRLGNSQSLLQDMVNRDYFNSKVNVEEKKDILFKRFKHVSNFLNKKERTYEYTEYEGLGYLLNGCLETETTSLIVNAFVCNEIKDFLNESEKPTILWAVIVNKGKDDHHCDLILMNEVNFDLESSKLKNFSNESAERVTDFLDFVKNEDSTPEKIQTVLKYCSKLSSLEIT